MTNRKDSHLKKASGMTGLNAKKVKQRNAGEEQILKKIADHCKFLRTQKNYSIDQVSKRAEKLSTSAVARVEAGAPVTINTFVKYAQAIGVPLKVLFDVDTHPVATKTGKIKFFLSNHARVKAEAFQKLLPYFSLKPSMGPLDVSRGLADKTDTWVEVLNKRLTPEMFVVQAIGRSMEPLILDQNFVVFKRVQHLPQQGAIVLIQYRGLSDPDTGGTFAIKKYRKSKMIGEEKSPQVQVTLESLNPEFESIVLTSNNDQSVQIIGEFQFVLNSENT